MGHGFHSYVEFIGGYWDNWNNNQETWGFQVSSFTDRAQLLKLKDIYIYIVSMYKLLNFTRSWGFGIFRVYWVSKSKCIISSNLRAEGSWGKVLNVVIFVESVVHRPNWRSRETETVGNSRKQSETVGNSRERPGVIMPKLSIRLFFSKKKLSAQSHFFLKVQQETVGNSWGSYLWLGKKRAI